MYQSLSQTNFMSLIMDAGITIPCALDDESWNRLRFNEVTLAKIISLSPTHT